MYHYVYKITNEINGKKYIGKRSCKCPIEKDRYMGSGTLLDKAKRKYGIENFKKDVLEVCISEEEAYNKERELIYSYNAVDNDIYYNLAEGGYGFTGNEVKKRWENKEYRRMMTENSRGMWRNENYRNKMIKINSNRTPYNKGKKISNETKIKISIASKSHWKCDIYRDKISNAAKKMWENPQHRNHMKEIMSGANNHFYGKQHTNETKDKIRKIHMNNKYRLGKKHTDETKRKIGKGNKGRVYGSDVREKVSNAAKKMWENPQHRNHMKEIMSGTNNPRSKKVICLNNMEIFETITSASDKTGIYLTGICRCCKGKRNYAGKINGEPAKWMYYEEYIILNKKQVL